MNDEMKKYLEQWLKENRLTRLVNGSRFMSYINNEDRFIVRTGKKITVTDFDEAYQKLMEDK